MRLDKFLKVTRIIKRRTIASELCSAGKVLVNGDEKKSSYEIKKDDELEIQYFNRVIKVKILEIPKPSIKKEEIENYIKII
ncbi:RNA-binding S4 domain-containing protein [Oceanivirga salmonicida]|uniref:RNA-binding S4 domain-containing protein n=1 Tax=Oceanivirga salmonicida TaxID=1769291 RepID=UPI000832B804|nr:S4 domain-containing protein [Oceanivirga salmonicida]